MTDQEFETLISRLRTLSAIDGDIGHEYWTLVVKQLQEMRLQALKTQISNIDKPR